MYQASNAYGDPILGKNVSIIGGANFGSEPYLIEIGDNTIGDNCIIGAGSIVNSDIPSNTVAAGTPCKVICTLEAYRNKHKNDFMYIVSKPFGEKKKILLDKFKARLS